MSVLVFAEISDGKFKKAAFEAVSYGRQVADLLGSKVVAVAIGQGADGSELGLYGAHQVKTISVGEAFTADAYAAAVQGVANEVSATTVIVSNTYTGKSLSPRLAQLMGASLASNVVSLPDTQDGFTVKRGVFSGKAFAFVNLTRTNKVLAITPNSFEIKTFGESAQVENSSVGLSNSGLTIDAVNKVTGKIPLTEAEVVISGGRGLKGPENWHLIEDLATALGAATACSKPVSDMEWRPHSEHVGQTGITIKPNLYVAVGISGAIQHLAGVSSSKVIVAINKDPEAPFFKAADYGIVGDAFEVLPQLIAAAKN
ncbi:MAG: electron transfer flavoprotein subunit alpha/FixB family protein [Bacteroidota bacterium]